MTLLFFEFLENIQN